ncbi:helix-turn-helix domain-containing protein [Asanoa sp. NPDC049573]|uniref:helix-turn-helix domain-containing protein n=1 Tax=Asanoa sp. NPDC049573 TaxID=3155396 RepID=UPI00343333A3
MPRMVTLAPSARLAPFVASLGYYEADLPDGRDASIPTGAAQLVVNLDRDELSWHDRHGRRHTRAGAGFCPPRAAPLEIDTAQQRRAVCVVFRPGGAYPFVGKVDALDEPVVALDDLWGRTDLRERLCTATGPRAALELLRADLDARATFAPDPGIAAAAAALHRGQGVGAASESLGLTTGTLRRRFTAQVGLAPKRFARVRRLQRLLATVTGDWAEAAAAVGYFDQTHMINDFRALTGLTPTAYRPRSAGERNHVSLPAARRSAPR